MDKIKGRKENKKNDLECHPWDCGMGGRHMKPGAYYQSYP
jgi:hypothetical protein